MQANPVPGKSDRHLAEPSFCVQILIEGKDVSDYSTFALVNTKSRMPSRVARTNGFPLLVIHLLESDQGTASQVSVWGCPPGLPR